MSGHSYSDGDGSNAWNGFMEKGKNIIENYVKNVNNYRKEYNIST